MTKEIRAFSKNGALIEERRNHIIECAARVFTTKGFHQATVRDIVEACGMSPGTLYRYIGSKQDILYLLLSRTAGIDKEICDMDLDTLDNVSWTDILRDAIRKHIQIVDDAQDWYMFNYTEMRHLPRDYRQGLLDAAAGVVAFYEKVLLKGIEAGEFEVEEPGMMAHNTAVLCHAWAIRRWYLRKRYTVEEYITKQTEYVLKTIRRRPDRLTGSRKNAEQCADTTIENSP